VPDTLADEIEKTPEFESVLQAIDDPAIDFLFVSGVAGTGKSTLISIARRNPAKNVIVVAPTGIAAMNIGGSTIHSMFRLAPGPMPDVSMLGRRGVEMLKQLDLLVIDEISMVKADLLDAISRSLSLYRQDPKPFGGVKVAAFGDLFQLAPVVDEDDEEILRTLGYESNFFFDAKCFYDLRFEVFQLTKTFRQLDPVFVEVLNDIRTGRNISEALQYINERCLTSSGLDDVALTLTTRTANADDRNAARLAALPHDEMVFVAEMTGEYFEGRADKQLPAPLNLKLKIGARVLFTKNNYPSWINGSLGTVSAILNDHIVVEKDDGERVVVYREEWQHIRHKINEQTKVIEREVVASFRQFPLRLGWAVTIHKSQGLTLDSCTVDVGEDGAFVHGQVYVALSRCKRIEALKLATPLTISDIKIHQSVLKFYVQHMPSAL